MPRYGDDLGYYDMDDFYDRMEVAWLENLTRHYERKVRELPDGQWYWDLLLKGERVNGGLSQTREDAQTDARFAMNRHAYSRGCRPVRPLGGGLEI